MEIIPSNKRRPFVLRSMYPWVGLWQWVGKNGFLGGFLDTTYYVVSSGWEILLCSGPAFSSLPLGMLCVCLV